jgi:hypothetical protein
VGEAVVLVQAAAALLLVVQLVRHGGWVLLVLQGLLVVVEGERKMWVDHNNIGGSLCESMEIEEGGKGGDPRGRWIGSC